MCESSVWLTVQLYHVLYAELTEKFRNHCASDRVHGIYGYGESGPGYGITVYKRKVLHHVSMCF